jgi:hypothetical protein
MELDLFSFAELPAHERLSSEAQAMRIRELLEEIRLADAVSLDVFGVGGPEQVAGGSPLHRTLRRCLPP